MRNWMYILIVIGAVLLICAIVAILIVLFKGSKKKYKKVNVDLDFINELLNSLGDKENILSYTVDNARVKFKLADLSKANMDKLKELSPRGVFITGSEIKTLFKYESSDIVKMLDNVLK